MCSAAFTDERIKIGDDIMARRSQPKDIPEDLRQSLVKLLTNFADELKQEAEELLGLKKFLLDYTLIAERQAIEVTLFEKYLIYAQMMGIAKQVAKEFKELYPEIIEQSSFGTYEDLIFITAYTSNYVTAVDTAISRANSYSSGGGGFSSGGRRRRLFRWWRWRRPAVSVKRKECDLT